MQKQKLWLADLSISEEPESLVEELFDVSTSLIHSFLKFLIFSMIYCLNIERTPNLCCDQCKSILQWLRGTRRLPSNQGMDVDKESERRGKWKAVPFHVEKSLLVSSSQSMLLYPAPHN